MKKSKAFERYLQEALKELEKPCEEFNAAKCERLLTKCCKVVINNQTDESVEVSPTEDPARALAEALSKLTPGVKTTVWNGESEDPQQQCQGKNNDGNPDGVNHESNCSEKFCESPFNL